MFAFDLQQTDVQENERECLNILIFLNVYIFMDQTHGLPDTG